MIEVEAKFLIQSEKIILENIPTPKIVSQYHNFFIKIINNSFQNFKQASLKKIILQNDIYYNSDNFDLKKKDKVLRNRQEYYFDEKSYNIKRNQSFLTYKGPNTSLSFKSREEIELSVDDSIWNIFQGLSFSPVRNVKKLRFDYTYSENFSISFDVVESLGYFFEVELIIEEKDIEDSEHKLNSFIQVNHLNQYKLEKRSYLTLIENTLTK